MRIINGLLYQVDGKQYPFVPTPNMGGRLTPRFLVMHFTAGVSAGSAIHWMSNPEAKAAAHIVIGRDGAITQMVPFEQVAWHAGKSSWQGLDNLNRHSIGIELDNPGRLVPSGEAWVSDPKNPKHKYSSSEVLVATHKHETAPSGWYKYPEVQLRAAQELAALLARTYALQDILGHEDIAPGRKADPGPAFPMDRFRATVMAMARLPLAG